MEAGPYAAMDAAGPETVSSHRGRHAADGAAGKLSPPDGRMYIREKFAENCLHAYAERRGNRMEFFQVVERGEGIEGAILKGLSRQGGLRRTYVSGRHPALLVVSPRAAEAGLTLSGTCRTVLLPGDAGAVLGDLQAASAVSYGASPRDSLTVSSREQGRLWAALQRELVTIDGQVVERQEFPVTLWDAREELSALAVAGALLLLGVPPEELSLQ